MDTDKRKIKINFSSLSRGQFLVEAIVSISIITIGLLSLLAFLSNSISLNRVIADQYVGTYLASEGIEVTKAIIDANIIKGLPWNQGISNGDYEVEYNSDILSAFANRYLKFNDGIYSYSLGAETPFRRRVHLTLVGADEIQVNSIVDWTTRGGGSFSANLEDHFYNWR